MTIDPEFLQLMPTPLVLNRYTGEDSFGNNTWGTNVAIDHSRVEALTRTIAVTTADGGTVLAEPGDTVQIIIDLIDPLVAVRDKITLPGDRVMRVISQTVEYDENGPYYQSLTCKNNQER